MKSTPHGIAAIMLALLASPCFAESGNWSADTSGNWSNSANWSPGPVADDVGFTAGFTNDLTVTRTVTLDTARTIGQLTFADANTASPAGWVLAGTSPLTLTVASGSPVISVSALAANQVAQVSTPLAGAAFTKKGAGTLVLAGANTFTTATLAFASENAGAVRVTRGDALGGIATVAMPGTNTNIARIELAGNLTLAPALTTAGRGPDSVFLKNLSDANAWSGNITINNTGGSYSIESAAGTLTLGGTLSTSVATARTFVLTGSGNGAVAGVVANGGGTISVQKEGSGTWTFLGPNTYSGTTTVTAGQLVVGNGGQLGTGAVSNNAQLVFSQANDLTVANAIGGTGTVVAGGAGALTLSGASSHSGGTTVTGTGKFSVANNSALGTDPTPGNNSATDTDTLTPQADLAVTITDSPEPVNALGNLTYTITLTSTGPSTAVSPSVSLPLPASTTFVSSSAPGTWATSAPAVGGIGTVTFSDVSLASGGSATFTVVAKVDINVVNDSTLTATATASSATTDPAPGNNSATATTLAKSGADLQIASVDSPAPVIAGTELTYTLQVANNGPLDAETVSITDALPAGTTFVSLSAPAGWSAATPAVGANGTVTLTHPLFVNAGTATFTLVVKVGSDVANGAVLSNTAAISSTTIDIAPVNNSATTSTTVDTRSDLAIDVAATPTTAPKGSDVSYTITLINNGPSDASAPNVSFPVPAQMTFVSATTAGGWSAVTPVVGGTGNVVFSAGSLATGSTVSFTVVAKVNANAPNGTVLVATATASATGVDPVPASNVDSATAAVGTLTLSAVQPITNGIGVSSQTGLFDVTVTVTNTTPLPINGFRLHVDYSAYKAAYPSLRLYNASSPAGASDVYIDYPFPVAVDALVSLKLSFYTSTRTFPSPFKPKLTVDILPTSQVADTNGSGVQPRLVMRPDTTVLLEFPSTVGRWYRVRYSSDLVHWQDCPVPLQAGTTRMQWIDSGPPFTDVPPSQAPSRFYRVNEIAAP